MTKKKWLMTSAWVLTLVGGAAQALEAYNLFDIMAIFGSTFGPLIKLVAGISAVWLSFMMLKKKR